MNIILFEFIIMDWIMYLVYDLSGCQKLYQKVFLSNQCQIKVILSEQCQIKVILSEQCQIKDI